MKILKWIGYILGGLVAIVVIALGVFYFMSEQELGTGHTVTPDAITIPTDAASLARGQHLVEAVTDCGGCHVADYRGEMFLDDPSFAQIAAPNLTSGAGGIGESYTDEDWVRALRHGVGADGRQLIIMPSQWYAYLTDEDLGAMVAYLKTLAPVEQSWPERSVAMIPTRILLALGAFPFATDMIANNAPRTAPEIAVSTEYGEYLTNIAACRECHGMDLAGGVNPGAPLGPNLTTGGAFAAYREEDFIKVMRTGVTPGGRTLSEEMPWEGYSNMTDDEFKALFQYLQSVEPLPNAGS
jgi:mono/diheme cytochrome c family protein